MTKMTATEAIQILIDLAKKARPHSRTQTLLAIEAAEAGLKRTTTPKKQVTK